MLAVSNFFSMFVLNNILRGGITRQITAGFFYACLMICGFVPPCWSVNAPTASKVLFNGKDGAVFYFPSTGKLFRMNNTEKTCPWEKHITPGATTEARHALYIYFLTQFPPVRKIKILDNKSYFVAWAKHGRRRLHAKAYSLERLKQYFEQEYREKVMC